MSVDDSRRFEKCKACGAEVDTEFHSDCPHCAALRSTLDEIRELIEPYVDVIDGDYGVPAANKAMRAVQLIDEALGRGGY